MQIGAPQILKRIAFGPGLAAAPAALAEPRRSTGCKRATPAAEAAPLRATLARCRDLAPEDNARAGQIWLDGHRRKMPRGQSGVIRGIFESYASGDSPRTIAAALNAGAVPPPRGVRWNASTINGNPQRGYGILSNEIYRGEVVWNRVQMVQDPDTGKRVSRPNPETEWQRAPALHLRIVPQPLWERVQLRRTDRTTGQTGPRRGRGLSRPKRPFSGLLRCGCCGGGISISKTRAESV